MSLTFPKSVPQYLIKKNPNLWRINEEKITIDLKNLQVTAGTAFIDPSDAYGKMGNPFTVITGNTVKDLTKETIKRISQWTNTPETIFVCKITKEKVDVIVSTPSGEQLGACAHGFLGTIEVLRQMDLFRESIVIESSTGKLITATAGTEKEILLNFTPEKTTSKELNENEWESILGRIPSNKLLKIASVGSPKGIIELSNQDFLALQKNLNKIRHSNVLKIQKKYDINGFHYFTRNSESELPEKCIQINAYLGEENMVDSATGVSNAAQIADDEKVSYEKTVLITQFNKAGSSAKLSINKSNEKEIYCGGNTILLGKQLVPDKLK